MILFITFLPSVSPSLTTTVTITVTITVITTVTTNENLTFIPSIHNMVRIIIRIISQIFNLLLYIQTFSHLPHLLIQQGFSNTNLNIDKPIIFIISSLLFTVTQVDLFTYIIIRIRFHMHNR